MAAPHRRMLPAGLWDDETRQDRASAGLILSPASSMLGFSTVVRRSCPNPSACVGPAVGPERDRSEEEKLPWQ